MNHEKPDIPVVLVTDCGSTTTKAILFEPRNGRLVRVAQAEAPTTVEAPQENILLGVREALWGLERQGTRRLWDDEQGLIRPSRHGADHEEGCDLYLSTCSAGGGLQVVAAGVARPFSARAAERAALGAGALVMDTLALGDGLDGAAIAARLRSLRPDMVLLCGGTDHGTERHVAELAEWIRVADLRPRLATQSRLPVIYAGNPAAGDVVRNILGDHVDFVSARNVLPEIDREDVQDARERVHELFMSHVMKQAPGTRELADLVDGDMLPTPAAVGRLLRRFGETHSCNLLAVDIGGATTDVFSVIDGRLERTVSANLGLSYSVGNVLAQAGLTDILRWLPHPVQTSHARNTIKNKMIRPTTLPLRVEDLLLEQALAREAMRLSLEQHRTFAAPSDEEDARLRLDRITHDGQARKGPWLSRLDWVIGSGGVLSHAPRRAQAALMLLDAFLPCGLFRLAVDRVFMMPHLGALLRVNEAAALDLFLRDALVVLGSVLAPWGKFRQGDPCVQMLVEPDNGPAMERTVRWGDFFRLPLATDTGARFYAKPLRGADLGGGPGMVREGRISGGEVGLIVDARGRPLSRFKDEAARRRQVRAWYEALDAIPSETIPEVRP